MSVPKYLLRQLPSLPLRLLLRLLP